MKHLLVLLLLLCSVSVSAQDMIVKKDGLFFCIFMLCRLPFNIVVDNILQNDVGPFVGAHEFKLHVA